MRLNRKDLRIIQYEFNSISNRLLQADFEDYTDVLVKFVSFVENNPLIFEFISDCGKCEWNVEEEVTSVQSSYGRMIFSTGNTDEEEVRNVYAVIKYIVDNRLSVYRGVAFGYSSSNKYQDKIKGFNNRFVMVLIRHIETYLTRVGIEMGVDESIIHNITVEHGQVIIASDNAIVNASNRIGIDKKELQLLINNVLELTDTLSERERQEVSDSLEVIGNEAVSDKPKLGMLRTAVKTLNAVKGITEFGAAVATLTQFISPII